MINFFVCHMREMYVDSKYSPSIPCFSKITKEGKLATDLCTYTDNVRSNTLSEE